MWCIARIWHTACIFCVWLLHLLVQRGYWLNGGVLWIDVHSLLCVGMKVQQSSHEVLDKTQGLARHVSRLKLKERQYNPQTVALVSLSDQSVFL